MISNPQSFLVVLLVAALAPILAGMVALRLPQLVVPVVVLELVLGVIVGPEVLGIAKDGDLLSTLSQLGLGFLFFFAGYEIRIGQIKGRPLKLAGTGWLISLALAYSLAGILQATGVIFSGLLVGSAIATTAIGTLIPILRDENRLGGEFGRQMLAIGAVGEFGPVLIVAVLLTASHGALRQIVLLAAFIVVAIAAALVANGAASRWMGFVTDRMENSGQLPVRLAVLLVFALVVLAADLGMDVILGAFAAGLIVRMIVGEREAEVFDSKMEAVGFGFLIPFFFILSGIQLDIGALFSSSYPVLRVAIFFVLMLVVRGVPELLLYRRELPREQLRPLALLSSTQLPLVVAISTIGLSTGDMKPETAAALVSAAVLTVMIFPALSIRLLGRADAASAS